jgi:hypothetical protein
MQSYYASPPIGLSRTFHLVGWRHEDRSFVPQNPGPCSARIGTSLHMLRLTERRSPCSSICISLSCFLWLRMSTGACFLTVYPCEGSAHGASSPRFISGVS